MKAATYSGTNLPLFVAFQGHISYHPYINIELGEEFGVREELGARVKNFKKLKKIALAPKKFLSYGNFTRINR